MLLIYTAKFSRSLGSDIGKENIYVKSKIAIVIWDMDMEVCLLETSI